MGGWRELDTLSLPLVAMVEKPSMPFMSPTSRMSTTRQSWLSFSIVLLLAWIKPNYHFPNEYGEMVFFSKCLNVQLSILIVQVSHSLYLLISFPPCLMRCSWLPCVCDQCWCTSMLKALWLEITPIPHLFRLPKQSLLLNSSLFIAQVCANPEKLKWEKTGSSKSFTLTLNQIQFYICLLLCIILLAKPIHHSDPALSAL